MATGSIKVNHVQSRIFTTVPNTITTEKGFLETVADTAMSTLEPKMSKGDVYVGCLAWTDHNNYAVEITKVDPSNLYFMIRSSRTTVYTGYALGTTYRFSKITGTEL